MDETISILKKYETWKVIRTLDKHFIRSQWLLALKRDHGRVIKLKTRLVAQGFRQIAGNLFSRNEKTMP